MVRRNKAGPIAPGNGHKAMKFPRVPGSDIAGRLLDAICRRTGALSRARQAELEWRQRMLTESQRIANVGSWRLVAPDDRVEWSEQTYRIMGVSPETYTPGVEAFFDMVHPDDLDRLKAKRDETLRGTGLYDMELRIVRPDGELRHLYLRAEKVLDSAGRPVRLEGTVQDITERKQYEQQLLYYRQLVEGSEDLCGICDAEYRYVLVNRAYAERYGTKPPELVGRHLRDIMGENDFAQARPAIDRCLAGENQRLEVCRHHGALGWRTLLVRYYPITASDGRTYHVAAVLTDITEQKRTEFERNEQARLLDIAGRVGRIGGWSADLDTGRVTGSDVVSEIHGTDLSNGLTVDEVFSLYPPEHRRRLRKVFKACAEQGRPYDEELQIIRPGGERAWVRAVAQAVFDDHGRVVRVHGALQDITPRKRAELELSRLAYEDRLTGLLSRNGFARGLSEYLERAGWAPDGLVVMLDVRGQRDINDIHGYRTGDSLLAALGRRLKEQTGPRGLAGRIGGDEFVLFLPRRPDRAPEQQLDALAEALKAPFVLDTLTLEITAYLGYTHLGEQPRAVDDLLREAELALFRHRLGDETARVAYTSELDQEARRRIHMTRELREALAQGQFELHFQPKVELGDGRLIGCEALLRWHHPERGLQPPGLFIPVAESSQLIGPIGDWVLREACRQLREWRNAGLDIVRVAVNVSLVQFLVGDFVGRVREALTEFDVDPAGLSLEITESVFERESESLLAQIRDLHEMGVRLSLDDFGTGYSSLLYLQKYPFDEIKIDQGFVRRLPEDPYSRDIVRTVMGLAAALGAEVVAEGIESAEVRNILLELDCRYGQGYYYSMPLAGEDFRWILEQRDCLPLINDGAA